MIRNTFLTALLFLFLTLPAFAQVSLGEPTTPTYKKARSLIIPEVKFNETLLSDAIEYFKKESAALAPDKTELNFVINNPSGSKEPTINLTLKKVPLSELLKYISSMTGYQVDYEINAIVLTAPEPSKKAGP